MMNYIKKILFISSFFAIFCVFAPTAFAGLVCSGTTASTANITETSSSGYCVGSSFLYRNGSMAGAIGCGTTFYDAGLAPSTSYNYTSSYGSTVCVTKPGAGTGGGGAGAGGGTGTVMTIPNHIYATWTLNGPGTINQFGTGSVTLNNKSRGVYTIIWDDIYGYTKTTTTQSYTLASGGNITFYNNYTPSFTAPVVSSPTVSSITSSSAILGANITSNGGTFITERGTCWWTTLLPTTCISEGGTALGIFSHLRTGMPAATTIYYRGYATNSMGRGYSSPLGIFTTSAPIIRDLTASIVATTAPIIAGNLTSFSAAISNTGTSGTGTPFTSLFQFDNDIDHTTSVFAFQNASTSVIPAGGTANISTSYTFPSAGTWYARACADRDTADVGTITETNEGNNCGAVWTLVTVVATTGILTTSNCIISTGLSSCSSTISWSITNPVAPNSVIQNGVGSPIASSGSMARAISYSGPNNFTLRSNGMTLATNTPAAACTGGTSWNGSVCAVLPVFSCIGATPLSATIYAGDTTGLSSNTPKTYSVTNTATKCQFSCNTGSSWNGTSCVAPTCGDGMCNGVETLLTCPKDCKAKVEQF